MVQEYQLLDKVRIKVETKKDGVVIKGDRIGVIDQMKASLWMGDYYTSGHTVRYRIVDNTYSQKFPTWVESNEILELIERQ